MGMKLKDVVFSKVMHEIEIYEAHDDDGMLIARLEVLSNIPKDFLLDVLASFCSDIPKR